MKRFLGMTLPTFNASVEPALSPLLADVARPLAAPTPCGRDVSYDSDFLRLKEEIEKLNAVDIRVDQQQATELTRQLKDERGQHRVHDDRAPTSPAVAARGFDPELVVSLAQSILRDHSKDLRVAAYLALGLARRDGLRGVAEGARAIELVAGSFWDGAFPPVSRMAGRMNAIESGVTWLRESLERITPTAADRDTLEAASRTVARMRELSVSWNNERVTQRLSSLATALSDANAKLPGESAPRRTAARSASSNGNHSAPDRSVGIPIAPEVSMPSPAQAVDPVIDRAARLLKEDLRRSTAYRLVRVYRWEPLILEPPGTKGRTRIEPPPARRREYLARLHGEKNWGEVLLQVEESFGQHPFHFWLDLQRFTIDALAALGAEYAAARDAVSRELQLLVARLPGLTGLSFADGTRFASPGVVTWLEGIVAGTSDGDARTVRAGDSSDVDPFADARKRFIGGDLNGALASLERNAAHETSDRQRFQRRAYMASLCLEAGQFAVARALLEELAQIVELHGLARWEPELAMSVWTRQYACYTSLAARVPRGGEAEQLGREMESVFGRICRVDTIRALATAQEGRRPP